MMAGFVKFSRQKTILTMTTFTYYMYANCGVNEPAQPVCCIYNVRCPLLLHFQADYLVH